MSDDQEFDYYKAYARVPKGQRLADSKETEGWSRGFTPKTSETGPQHGEFLIGEKAANPASDFDPLSDGFSNNSASYENNEQDVNELLAAAILIAILWAAEVSAPRIVRWWRDTVIPYVTGRIRAAKLWRRRRKNNQDSWKSEAPAQIDYVSYDEKTAASSTLVRYEADMSDTDARRHLIELMIAQHFVNQKQRLLANARINDRLSTKANRIIQGITPKQLEQALESMLTSSPSFFEELGSLLSRAPNGDLLYPGSGTLEEALQLTNPEVASDEYRSENSER